MSRIEEVDARLTELRSMDLDAEGIDLKAILEETHSLNEERAQLMAEEETRQAELAAIAAEEVRTAETTTIVEDTKMEVKEIRNSVEYVNAFAEYIKSGNDAECRALVSENGTNGTVAVPELVDDIVRHAWDKEGIMALVKKSFIAGNLKVGFEISSTGAVVHEENSGAVTEETLVLGIVELVPASIKKWIHVTDEVMDLRGEAFLRYVYEELAYQIAKKAADELVAKIVAAPQTSTTTAVAVPVVSEATIGLGTIAKAISELSDEADNPVIIMNKSTWASFKSTQYAGQYAVDPFEGLPVLFNNTITAYSAATTGKTYAIVGDLGKGALANFPAGSQITFKFDDKSEAEKDLVKIVGREYVGLGVVAPKAFVKINK